MALPSCIAISSTWCSGHVSMKDDKNPTTTSSSVRSGGKLAGSSLKRCWFQNCSLSPSAKLLTIQQPQFLAQPNLGLQAKGALGIMKESLFTNWWLWKLLGCFSEFFEGSEADLVSFGEGCFSTRSKWNQVLWLRQVLRLMKQEHSHFWDNMAPAENKTFTL